MLFSFLGPLGASTECHQRYFLKAAAGALANLTIQVIQSVNETDTTVATNDDRETQSATAAFTAAEVRELTTKAGAFTLPSGPKDASLLFTTSTNTSCTVLVSGAAPAAQARR